MSHDHAFGQQVRQRRRSLDLTQEELARRVGCAAITLRKIEAGDLRPSQQIAERLAMALAIPLDERAEFVRRARSVQVPGHPLEPTPTPQVMPEEIGLEDLSGRAIRGYQLGEKIGAGSFGAVYRGVQPLVEREVAIKIILPAYANHPDFIRRFEAEAQMVARLEHPHIVPLYDYWREPGVAYLVMRLLRGGSVEDLLHGGPLPIDLITCLLEQIVAALHVAHRAGVIHRDLKPSNILLDEDRNAYLADFGIAKNLGNPDEQTQVGMIIGSPAYISPEQVRSEPVRPQADIYSLGVMLYEMLTGAKPFLGPTPLDLIQQHLYTPLPPLAAQRPGLPAALDEVVAHATAKNPDDRYADVEVLLADFHAALHAEQAVMPRPIVSAPPIEIVNPYKGLRPFAEIDAPDFHGREGLTQQLLARLGEGGDLSRFLAVIGPSGSGKSSVVRAGLVPALRRGGLPHSENWFIVEVLPGPHPLEELEAALLRIAVNPPESLLAQIKEDRRGLLRAIQRTLPADPDIELVLVLDQFEEVFTLVTDEAERSHLLDCLVATVLDERSRARIILTLRADFIDKPLRYMDFGELLQRRSELVLPLTPDEMEHAIVGPAQRVGLQLEAGLPEAIIANVNDQPGALPLLQYALTELFDQRSGNLLTKAAYQSIGGVKGALGRRAEEVYQALDEAQQATARQVFLRLVMLGEGTEDVRRRVLRTELETLTPIPSPFQGEGRRGEGGITMVLDAFGKARLLSFDRDLQTRGPTVEVAHEALLREWPRLREWLIESRAEVRMQRLLANETAEWLKANREASFLLRGSRLQQFEDWAKTTNIALTSDERSYLEASLAEREGQRLAEEQRRAREAKLEHRAKRVLQGLFAVAVIAAIISGALAVLANIQRSRAETAELDARSQAGILLASQSMSELNDGYSDRAVLLALEALDHYPYSAQAEHALAQAVTYNRAEHFLSGHTGAVPGVAWSPDAQLVATASTDKTVRVWNAKSGTEVKRYNLDDLAVVVAWSPDGKYLATGTSNRFMYGSGSQAVRVNLWDTTTGRQLQEFAPGASLGVTNAATLVENFNANHALAFSPDSQRLAIIGGYKTVAIYDIASSTEVLTLTGHTDFVHATVWSNNGERLATTSEDATTRIWNARDGAELFTLKDHTGPVNSAAWSPDDTQLATVGEDGKLKLWDTLTGKLITSINADKERVWDVAWSQVGNRIATANANGSVTVWDPDTGGALVTLRGHARWALSVAWSPINQDLVSGSHDGTVYIWKATDGTEVVHVPESSQATEYVAWLPNSKQIAVSGGTFLQPGLIDGSVHVWDVTTGKLQAVFDQPTDAVYEAEWSPDGKRILTRQTIGNELPNQEIFFIWDAETLQIAHAITLTTWLRDAAWSPDSQHVAVSNFDGTAIVFDAVTGQRQVTFKGHAPDSIVTSVRWSPDGKRIATTSGRSERLIRIWNPNTGEELMKLEGHESNVNWVEWSPSGDRLCTTAGDMEVGGKDNSLRIWDANTGQLLKVILGHEEGLWICVWSPNGKRVATTSIDGTTRVWDVETGAEILTLQTPTDWYLHADWSPDGKYLVTGGGPSDPRVWQVWQTTQELIDYAKSCCAVRELTLAERQQFGLLSK